MSKDNENDLQYIVSESIKAARDNKQNNYSQITSEDHDKLRNMEYALDEKILEFKKLKTDIIDFLEGDNAAHYS